MFKKIESYIKLIRLPNGFTAIADSWAGYLALANQVNLLKLITLGLISFCLYSAGIIINDLYDYKKDLIHHPYRPLAAGLVSKKNAYIFLTLLIFIGLASSFLLGKFNIIISFLLLLNIILYDVLVKKYIYLSSFIMGLCRFLNFCIGMSVSLISFDQLIIYSYLPLFLLIYVMLLTLGSKFENISNISRKIFFYISGFISIYFILGFASGIFKNYFALMLVFILLILMIYFIRRKRIDTVIKSFIFFIIIFDFIIVLAFTAKYESFIVLFLIIPTLLFSKIKST